MSQFIKYSIINGELHLYFTPNEYEYIQPNCKLIFHVTPKEKKEEILKKKILAEIDELKQLISNMNH